MPDLDEILKHLAGLSDKEKEALIETARKKKETCPWLPSPGPQTQAYFSEADILLFGGEPGGGKTDLLLGLAFNCHQRSLILRRQYTDINAIVERMLKINGTRKGFNGSPPPALKRGNQLIELAGAAKVGDEQHWQGQAHDFLGFDEGAQFAESQVRFLMGWLRSVDAKQRIRCVIATNPPLSSEGLWLIEMFAPWLDPRHPNPAKPGELRWFITDDDGKDVEVDDGSPIVYRGNPVTPLSRTFIPSSVTDNPYLASTNYQSQLAAMPEPFRSILLGRFQTSFKDQLNQVIPTNWIKEAQARWTAKPRLGVPMCAIGVDVAAGGEAETVLAPRYDGWFAPLEAVPGRATPFGSDVAGLIVAKRRDNAMVVIDVGGGYGNGALEHLVTNSIPVAPYNGATAVEAKSKDRQLTLLNKRALSWWRFREALDPDQEGGSPIMLPEDPKLVADLSAPTFRVTPRGIYIEDKKDIMKRLGRSPDRGDAVVMAYSAGPVYISDGGEWIAKREMLRSNKHPKVIMGRQPRK